jgi:hypothetical protein
LAARHAGGAGGGDGGSGGAGVSPIAAAAGTQADRLLKLGDLWVDALLSAQLASSYKPSRWSISPRCARWSASPRRQEWSPRTRQTSPAAAALAR